MSTTQDRVVPLRPDLELTVREQGDGRLLLLLHGGPGPDSLTPLAEHLAQRHQVLLPVHPGWEDTPRPPALDSVPRLAEAYLQLLDDRAAGPATVVGTSFGGWVAAEMAAQDQGRQLERLVLMDAIGPVLPGREIAVPGQRSDTAGKPTTPPATGPSSSPRGPSPASMAALRAYAGSDMADPHLLGRLEPFARPVLIVWGQNDPVVSPVYGHAYTAAFPDASFTLIPDAGHLPIREQPQATFVAIDQFLASNDSD